MMKKALIAFFLIVLSGIYAYHFNLTRSECISIQGLFIRWNDYEREKNIKTALQNIRVYSPEDYNRICTRASSIRISSFENELVPFVSPDARGTYAPDRSNLAAKGIIIIDRDATDGSMIGLERTLVHEACHAFLIQESADFSEEPCYSRDSEYFDLRPKEPTEPKKVEPEKSLEQKSAEFIEQTGERFHAYCSLKEQNAPAVQGDCVFINYTTESKQMCANVFLKRGEIKAVEQEICGEVGAVDYRSISFELQYPKNAQESDKYQFGFSPHD